MRDLTVSKTFNIGVDTMAKLAELGREAGTQNANWILTKCINDAHESMTIMRNMRERENQEAK